MILDLETNRASRDANDIAKLYESMMKGYAEDRADSFPLLKEDGYFTVLYAPGYENNGVAELSAESL